MKKLIICLSLMFSAIILPAEKCTVATTKYGFKDLMRFDDPPSCWRCSCDPFYGAYCCYKVC